MATARLKRRMKFAPKMSRELRAEYLLTAIDAGPRRLSDGTIQKLKAELVRLSSSTDPRVRKFVRAMEQRYPGVTG
jgi:transposase